MCMFGGAPKAPQIQEPKETQYQKEPDGGTIKSDQRRRLEDRQRAQAATVLTGGMGVTQDSSLAGKTLLGT